MRHNSSLLGYGLHGSHLIEKVQNRDFPGVPVVKTLLSNAGGEGSIPGQGTTILHATQCGQKKELLGSFFKKKETYVE